MNLHDLPLMIVALIVFAGMFAFLWNIDARTKRLENELRDEIAHNEDAVSSRDAR